MSIASVGDGIHNSEHYWDVRRGRDALSAGVSGFTYSIAGPASQEDVLCCSSSGRTAAVVRGLRLERSMLSPKVQVTVPERTNVTALEQLSRASTPDAVSLNHCGDGGHSSQSCWRGGDQDSCRWCLQSRRRRTINPTCSSRRASERFRIAVAAREVRLKRVFMKSVSARHARSVFASVVFCVTIGACRLHDQKRRQFSSSHKFSALVISLRATLCRTCC